MKKLIKHWIKALALLAILLFYTNANAQVGNFNITVENLTQTAVNKLEFDVYLLDTDPGQPFELGTCQLGFLFNSSIYSGGSVSVAINNSGSGLNSSQTFSAVPNSSTIIGSQTLVKLAGRTPPGSGNGTIISTSGHGTLVTHFIITSTIAFTSNSIADLTFTSSLAITPSYATSVSEYIAAVNTALSVTPGVNAIVNGNPVLNPLVAPTPFTVTGGGSYCQGSGGLPVGLSDSEIGVTYTLMRNAIDQSPTVAGTGSAFSFGSNFPGTYTYTVRGTNGSGTTPMLNSVIITENPNAAITLTSGAGTNAQTLCINTAISNITYSVTGGGTGAGVTGLPTGVTGSYSGGVFTISGTPTVSGTFNYTVTTTGSCVQATANGSITVRPNAAITLTSAAGTNAQTPCINTAITNITYSVTGGGTGAGVTGLPTGVTGSYSGGVFTISGTPIVSGTFNYTVTTTGTCVQATANGSITVRLNAAIALTSAAGTDAQTPCINTTITNITYSVTGGGTGAGVTGLPTGVTGSYSGGVFTISGTPSVSGTFNYTVTTTGACVQSTANGSITVRPNASITLTSGAGTNVQNPCINTAITNITYSVTGGGTGAGVVGLPTGVSGSYSGGVFTISGTPTVPGTFNYTVTTTGSCVQATANGSITVGSNGVVTLTSAIGTDVQTPCINTVITNITYSVIGASGAGVVGLPTGVTGSYSGGVFTISGTPTVSGTFNYTVTTTGACVQGIANGSITVRPNATLSLTSGAGTNAQTLCINTAITNITYSVTGGGTGAGVTGLPTGVTGSYSGGVFTISGTPTVSGTFNYTVTTTGSCVQATANGSILVRPNATITLTSAVGTDSQTHCINNAITNITYLVSGGGTGAGVAGLPSGVVGVYSGGVFTISGTPTTPGTFNYIVTTTGTCTQATANGTITVNALPAAPTVGTITQPTCLVGTGTITITAPTGAGMTFSIDGLTYTNTTGIFTLVTPGTYTVTAKNIAGCISPGTSATIITQPPTPVVNNQTASIMSGGTFTVTPSGGTIPVGTTYTWPAPTYTGGVIGGVAQLTPLLNITGTLTIPSGVGTATYIVTPTSGTCVGATFTVIVTVTSTCTGVTVGTQPANISMCATAGPVTFTVSANGTAPFTYQWQYNNAGTWASVVNGTPLGAVYTNATTTVLSVSGISTAGSYQYRCLVTNCGGGNSVFSNTATLTVNASPIPTLSSSDPDNVFCFGTSVTFTAGGGTGYNFRVNGTTVQNGALTTYTTATLANGQIVTVIVTGADGCTATSAQIQNIVNPLPFIILSTAPTCSTDFLTYSLGVTVGSGTVTCPSGTVTNMGGNIWTITAIPAHTNVTVRVTDSGGCENTLNITAPDCNCPVVPAPVSSGDRSYCAGGIIPVLSVTVPAGGNPKTVDWYNSSSGGTILLSGSLSYTPSAAGTYYAVTREISSSCVSSTRTPVILTMNPLPVPTLTSSDADNIFCGGTSVIFTAGGGTNYNFLVGGLSRQDGASATYTTSTLTNGQSVVAIVTNANGCSATSASITNTVNPTPVPTLTSSDADNSFCAGTNVTFTAGGGTNYNFRVGGVSVQNGVLTTYSTNSLTNGQVVDVVVSNTYGCLATSTGITNSVFAAPAANAGTGGNNCGLGFNLNGSLNVGIGTWAKVSGPGSVSFSPDANTPTATVTVSSFGTYVFSWTVANGTCTSSANVTVIFIQQPPAEAGTGGHECDKDFIMNAVITTGVGTWTKISGPGTAVFTPDNHQANAKVTVDQFGTYSFGWTVVNSICTSSDNVTVVFHDLPPINAGRDTAFCKGGSVLLHAQGVGTVSWTPPDLVSNPIIINPVATPITTTTFTVNLTDQFGCKNSDNIVVEVREKPVANAGPDQELTYVLKTTMDAILAHSYETGVWSVVPKSTTIEFADSTYSKTLVSNLSLGRNKFLWTVKNGYCPSSSDTVMITVNNFIIPTMITPNMDGRNDYFVLRGLATMGKTELLIFDRRGNQVYRNTNYDNSWNGVDYNKNPLPSDTYFYVLKSLNGISTSGYIVIRR